MIRSLVSTPWRTDCLELSLRNCLVLVLISSYCLGYGIAVGIIMAISFVLGIAGYFRVQNEAANFFVAGNSLPLWMVAVVSTQKARNIFLALISHETCHFLFFQTLASCAVDSNALLKNVDLSYKYHFYDGASIAIGLGLSLFLNSIFFAGKINKEGVLTLPDVLARRYGKIVEVLVSLTTIASFIMLLAGNLVGVGLIQAYVWNISVSGSIWLAAAILWVYTVCGGLFSVAYTDVVQAAIGWSGVLVAGFWFIANAQEQAPPPSIGFPGYMYPNDEICQMYDGVPCANVTNACCYNEAKWCTGENVQNCTTDVSRSSINFLLCNDLVAKVMRLF